ncbi:helix-turn-helix domain-containing protein [Candidatus Latescibacterota bacterium]
MVENIRAVQNPLTIIAIFAALAEIAGTVALSLIVSEFQSVFIWFVMLFPIFLVACFFLTLNFNPQVLYAPSDFKNEENFLEIIVGSRRITENLKTIDMDLDNFKQDFASKYIKKLDSLRDKDAKLESDIVKRIELISGQIEKTLQSSEELSSELTTGIYTHSHFQTQIVKFMEQADEPVEIGEIAKTLGNSKAATLRALERMISRGFVESVAVDKSSRPGMTLCFQLKKSGMGKKQPLIEGDADSHVS